jgi:plastocyanin
MTPNKLRTVVCLALAAAALASACSGEKPAATNTPPPNAQRVDESKAGTVNGRVLFEGPAPANPSLPMGADPVCARENQDGATSETVLVDDGGLENVFVYVKDGLGNYYFDTPTDPVKLDQKGCRYTPHVFGIRVGQPLEVINSDATLHNVHSMGQVNQEFNFPQQIQGMRTTKTFTAREVMVPFKCDVHGWMNAYAGVLDHPYFAVTGSGGRFELKTLPAGTYTIEAWHEKLGTRSLSVTLGEKETKDISFTFTSGATT